ncbi:MDR family MFS transporter [Micromonospora sp. WMMD812]|uniref:MDR family MFS transporter n=1 Tax=Micromonospora sp. WMMD812 TaxID=3015152 RepID=UPI00248CF383|nr:MDR family MFS transporter [Micromonospora sp. WMMD812]WBB69058.1 MDR family MFS transporter [Micromonospora sp. WMMD812]
MTLTASTFRARPAATSTPPVRLARPDVTVIGALLAATFVVVLSATVMTVAIPPLIHDLAVPATSAQWLTTGYMLTMAIVIPITAFLAHRFRLRPLYITAMSLFLAGTLLSATAPGFQTLLIGRVVQATGGAIITPLMLTTVATLVPTAVRGRTMGVITLVMAVAPALGPTASGLIVDALGWRALFWLTLPIAAAAFVFGLLVVRDVSEPAPARFELLSALLSAIGFGGVIIGLTGLAGKAGSSSGLPAWASLTLGAAALALFTRRQLRLGDRALVDLRTFRAPAFATGVALLALTMIGLFGALLLLPLYLQDVRGLTTAQTGLALLPGGITAGILAPLVGRISDRHGPGAVLTPGAIVLSSALWTLAFTGEHTDYGWVVAAHVLLNVGVALLMTPLFTVGLNATAGPLSSHASAILNTVQQVAGAAGGALLIALTSAITRSRTSHGTNEQIAAAAGIHGGFLTAASISLAGIGLAVGIARSRRPRAEKPTRTTYDGRRGAWRGQRCPTAPRHL